MVDEDIDEVDPDTANEEADATIWVVRGVEAEEELFWVKSGISVEMAVSSGSGLPEVAVFDGDVVVEFVSAVGKKDASIAVFT